MAELILCRHEVTGHETDLPKDALPAWRAVGWKPVSEYPKAKQEPPAPVAEPEPTTKPAPRNKRTDNEE